jgi:uncharacterized protein YodC (DUF2158 family)
MADFQIGDVVKLKSGGPKMTVTGTGKDMSGKPTVGCTWFVQHDTKKETGAFPVEAVEAVIDAPEPPLQTRANTGRPRRI